MWKIFKGIKKWLKRLSRTGYSEQRRMMNHLVGWVKENPGGLGGKKGLMLQICLAYGSSIDPRYLFHANHSLTRTPLLQTQVDLLGTSD